MRLPCGDAVLVEVEEDGGLLVTVNNNYGIVRVLAKPLRPSLDGLNRDTWDSFKIGDVLLVNALRDYVVKDTKYHITLLADIVGVL